MATETVYICDRCKNSSKTRRSLYKVDIQSQASTTAIIRSFDLCQSCKSDLFIEFMAERDD